MSKPIGIFVWIDVGGVTYRYIYNLEEFKNEVKDKKGLIVLAKDIKTDFVEL
jgi:hypothetical protein